jgi:O-antigen ligase
MIVKQSSASLVSQVVAFVPPLLLAAYWPFLSFGYEMHKGMIAIRLGVLAGAAVLFLLWRRGATTPAELKSTGLLALWLSVMLIPALFGESLSKGLHNWIRILPVCCSALMLARALRNRATRQAFGMALGMAGAASFLFILAIYFHFAEGLIPTYERIRVFKSLVLRSSGVALNPLASATLFFCILSLCLLRSRWPLRVLVGTIAVGSSVFTGSRAPLAFAVAACAALCITNLLHRGTIIARAAACTLVCFSLTAASLAGPLLLTPHQLSAATTGRYDLWMAGVEKFLERPLTGYGPETWHDDLASRLPSYYEETTGLARLRTGGFHSEFITLLAEGGLICFIPAMIIFGLLYRSCCRIAFHTNVDRFNGQAMIFAFFLFFFRAAVEVPGLFGYGEDVTDYLAAIFVAIVVGHLSFLQKRRASTEASLSFDGRASQVAEQRG